MGFFLVLTVDVEKDSLAHSWRNVVFRNAEISSQVPSIDIHEAHQFALECITLGLAAIVGLHDYCAAVISPPCDACFFVCLRPFAKWREKQV